MLKAVRVCAELCEDDSFPVISALIEVLTSMPAALTGPSMSGTRLNDVAWELKPAFPYVPVTDRACLNAVRNHMPVAVLS